MARHGTVTAAAEVCHLTPSAVSHQLQALARELDVVLLEHTGRNVRLTAAAYTLLAHADALAARWERAQAGPGRVSEQYDHRPAVAMRDILAAIRAGSGDQPAIAAGLDALRQIATRQREDTAPDSETRGHTIPEPCPSAR